VSAQSAASRSAPSAGLASQLLLQQWCARARVRARVSDRVCACAVGAVGRAVREAIPCPSPRDSRRNLPPPPPRRRRRTVAAATRRRC
jgi:hypothetical protein